MRILSRVLSIALWGVVLSSIGCRQMLQPLPGPGRDGRFYCYTTDYFTPECRFVLPGKSLTARTGDGSWEIIPPPTAFFPGFPLVCLERYLICPLTDTFLLPYDLWLQKRNAVVCAKEGVWIRVVDQRGLPIHRVEIDLAFSANRLIYGGHVREKSGAVELAVFTDEQGDAYIPVDLASILLDCQFSGSVMTSVGLESFDGAFGARGAWRRLGSAEADLLSWSGRDGCFERFYGPCRNLSDRKHSIVIRLKGQVNDIASGFQMPECVTFLARSRPDDFVQKFRRTAGGEIFRSWNSDPLPARVADFDAFWDGARQRMRTEWTGRVEVEELAAASTPSVRVCRVSFGAAGRTFVGWLSEPRTNVVTTVPALAFFGSCQDPSLEELPKPADQTVLYLSVFPPDYDYHRAEYDIRERYRLSQWAVCEGYALDGIDRGRESYFFYPVLSATLRAVEWLKEKGGSGGVRCVGTGQGAALAIMTAALSDQVCKVDAHHPEFCYIMEDLNAWPEFRWHNRSGKMAEARKWMPYYELCSFAPRVKCPVDFLLNMRETPALRKGIATLCVARSLPGGCSRRIFVDNNLSNSEALKCLLEGNYLKYSDLENGVPVLRCPSGGNYP